MPFSARADIVDIVVKIKIKTYKSKYGLLWSVLDNEYASLVFSQTYFSYCFCILSDFAKVFERRV